MHLSRFVSGGCHKSLILVQMLPLHITSNKSLDPLPRNQMSSSILVCLPLPFLRVSLVLSCEQVKVVVILVTDRESCHMELIEGRFHDVCVEQRSLPVYPLTDSN